jgi:hypothetical protein
VAKAAVMARFGAADKWNVDSQRVEKLLQVTENSETAGR